MRIALITVKYAEDGNQMESARIVQCFAAPLNHEEVRGNLHKQLDAVLDELNRALKGGKIP